MKNLIQKILGKDKPKIRNTLNADEIKPIFEAVGINIETIGFPFINERHNTPTYSYWTQFKKVNIKPIKINEEVSTIITGRYETQPKASYQDSGGGWHPGGISYYSFKIQEGKLNIRRHN